MKRLFILFITILTPFAAMATHNRAGEITYRQLSDLTYEITVTTYTATGPGQTADREALEVSWGDGTSDTVPRNGNILTLPNYHQRNKYIYKHTYPGPGVYEIVVEDPNRNVGVENIPNSVNVIFTIKSILQINPDIGYNSTPVLLNPPLDKAAKDILFVHNPAAYDPDGDSLSYKITTCLSQDGEPIPDYEFPESTNREIFVNPVTGDLVWDAPAKVGIYNVAMLIEEWRDGVKIGKILRDMQIEVVETDQHPPELGPVSDWCVRAGDTIDFTVSATDVDGDSMLIFGVGGPLSLDESPAQFDSVIGHSPVSSHFNWPTTCDHVRLRDYQVIFKAQDYNYFINLYGNNDTLSLFDQKITNIKVISPPPENLTIKSTFNTAELTWEPCICDKAKGYYIYRRKMPFGFVPDSCETGVPEYTGYTKIAEVKGLNNTYFMDNDDGKGLKQGFRYCYMVVAYFLDGAESVASQEVCVDLKQGIPVITNASVQHTDTQSGENYVAWRQPRDIDEEKYPPPYRYEIFPSDDLWAQQKNFNKIIKEELSDTTLFDKNRNTYEKPHSYLIRVHHYNESLKEWVQIGVPSVASTVLAKTESKDNAIALTADFNTPWLNEKFQFYLVDSISLEKELLATVDSSYFLHNGLKNNQRYCYTIRTMGYYPIDDPVDTLYNWSQMVCATPGDTVPPCQPSLSLESNCDSLYITLNWQNPNNYCSDDALSYEIYYSPTIEGELEMITTIDDIENTNYVHFPDISMAGCYAVAAIDSFGNRSAIEQRVCIDDCEYYDLPNVFSPDNDGINDIYKPFPYNFVEKVEMKIYNRWGKLVFETTNPDINWDGRYMNTNQYVTDGVYYYICDVYEQRLSGIEPRNLVGFIHVFSGEKGNKSSDQ